MPSSYFVEIPNEGGIDLIPVPDIERVGFTPASDTNDHQEYLVIWMKPQQAQGLSVKHPKYEYFGNHAALGLLVLRELRLPGTQ